MKFIILLLLTISCASDKNYIPGYSGSKLNNVLRKLEGKSRQEARQMLGTPAIEGRCKFICGPKDVYRMIYPKNDTDSFYLDVTANTDERIDCVVLDFYPDLKKKKFIYKSFKKAKDCNNSNGEIQFLKAYMMSPDGKTIIKKD